MNAWTRVARRIVIGMVVATILGQGAVAAYAQQALARIYNRTNEAVTVYAESIDFLGNRSWRQVGLIPPGAFLDIPGAPAGTRLGAQSASGRQWPPFQVQYRGGPFFEYNLYR